MSQQLLSLERSLPGLTGPDCFPGLRVLGAVHLLSGDLPLPTYRHGLLRRRLLLHRQQERKSFEVKLEGFNPGAL